MSHLRVSAEPVRRQRIWTRWTRSRDTIVVGCCFAGEDRRIRRAAPSAPGGAVTACVHDRSPHAKSSVVVAKSTHQFKVSPPILMAPTANELSVLRANG